MGISIKATSVAVPAATPTPLVGANNDRKHLCIVVNGVNPVTIKFGSAPASVTDGISLDGSSVVGGQGGSIWYGELDAPTDAIFAWSTLGTTVSVAQGT
ncbi:hypothetical protein ABIB95_006284 [Bradyrhizobium sp. LA2.1]